VTTSTREATRRAGFRERWTLRQWERLKDLLTAFGPTANVHRPFLEESLLWTALWTGYPTFPPPHVIDVVVAARSRTAMERRRGCSRPTDACQRSRDERPQ
jgi:hypothetical protein